MKVAVLGATGAVGRTMLAVLEERRFPVEELVLLASARSAGTTLPWRGREWPVGECSADAFAGCGVALFSAGATRSREWAPVAAEAGAVVIDNSSGWRMHPDVPLVVPEVNAAAAAERPLGIIANPNCATIQLVVALAPLHGEGGLRRVVATTFQSVSGAGQTGLGALTSELDGRPAPDSPFVAPIAGNVIPWIGPRGEDGWNEEEHKIRLETRKILDLPDLPVAATCVRVPVARGHAISVTVELDRPLTAGDAAAVLGAAGVVVHSGGRDPFPLEVAGSDAVHVGRLRADADVPGTLHMWIVADNLRKGAATNAVQIAESLAPAHPVAAGDHA
jgi:aspartate-semialdehyde dehydrogenase